MDLPNKSGQSESVFSELFLIITTFVALLSTLIYKFVKIWLIFRKKNVKRELGIPVLGTHWREIFKIESWHNTVKRFYYKYPDVRFVVLQDIGGKAAYLIRDPELVKQIAVTDFSSFVDRISGFHPVTDPIHGHRLTNTVTGNWRRIRNLVTPFLSGQKLKQVVIPSLDETNRDVVNYLNEKMLIDGGDELVVNMLDLGTRSVVDGFCLIAFGVKADSLRSNGQEYGFFESAESYLKYRNEMSRGTYWAIIHFPRLMKYLFGKTLMPVEDNDFFISACNDIADTRIENEINRSDFIHLLQSLRDKTKADDDKFKDYTEIEAIAQSYDFYQSIITENNVIIAFISRQLAKNVVVQDRLFEEIAKVNRRVGEKQLNYDDLTEMKYAEMVIQEGLRLCPIVTELKRRATKPYVFEDHNGERVTVNPGDAVWLPAFTMQTDPQYYPNPSEFIPERFSDENRKSHVTGTYAPFGLGPRDCVGCKHPMMDLKMLFYYLLLEFKIECAGENAGKNSVKLRRRRSR